MAHRFIHQKASQLVYFASHFLAGELAHSELHLFIWDTLEEWAALADKQQPPDKQEQVFWFLLFQLEYWPAEQLRSNTLVKAKLQSCLRFLNGSGHYPADCLGVRP